MYLAAKWRVEDNCPHDATKLEPGVCGCGLSDEDTDTDGVMDCDDGCPFDPTQTSGDSLCSEPPCSGSVNDLWPVFECVLERSNGERAAVFTVRNETACLVEAPYGPDNEFTQEPAIRGQQVVFFPGRERVIISPFDGPMTWKLGSRTAAADLAGPPCTTVIENGEGPVVLTPTFDHGSGQTDDDHVQTGTPVEFTIPARLRVSNGNASNGTAELSYRTPAGAIVTCTYRGGSSVASPTTDLDFARGLALELESCSNGLAAGATATGTEWDLVVNGGDPRFPVTGVDLHLGPGCGGKLEPAITSEETVLLRQGFNWSATSALPVTTNEPGLSQPAPAMHYAIIYVNNDEQYDQMNRSGLYFRKLPLFPSELERYRDKCGTVDGRGDLRGEFVFSLMPASVYNLIRDQALAAQSAGTDVAFPAVILRSIPDASLRNADGTLSWRAMAAADFQYFPDGAVQQPFFDDLFEGIGNLLEGAWEAGTQALGELADELLGEVNVRLDFHVMGRDPLVFALWRGWGPLTPLELQGAQVEILQWSLEAVPTSHIGTLDQNGRVRMEATDNSEPRGSGLCLHMENDAAQIGEGVTEDEICDFRVFGEDSLDQDFPGGGDYETVLLYDDQSYYLAQLTDGYNYMRFVGGEAPGKQAEVGVGVFANLVGALNGGLAYTGCLDYGALKNSSFGILSLVLTPGGAAILDFVAGPFLAKDIILPNEVSSRFSRAVVTHEYGHYVMCDVFDQEGALFDLYAARVFNEGVGEDLDSQVGMAMEGFADFFASQVASGVNYPELLDATDTLLSETMTYCTGPDCLERNFRGIFDGHDVDLDNDGTPEPRNLYRDQVARLVSTFHDAFDHTVEWRGTLRPTNADAWQHIVFANGDRLVVAGPDAGRFQPDVDDDVALFGSAIHDWLVEAAHQPLGAEWGAMQTALAEVMFDRSVNWCDACELFAMHDRVIDSTALLVREVWQACADPLGELVQIVGPPIDPAMRYSASCGFCPNNHRSDENGVCIPCNLQNRERIDGNACVQCDSGQIADPSTHSCVPCNDAQITVGNSCTACPFPHRADRATNTCEACPPDFVSDMSVLQPGIDCLEPALNILFNGAPNDLCPDEIWLEIANVDRLATTGATPSDLELKVFGFNLATSECTSQVLSFHQDNERIEASGTTNETGALRTVAGVPCATYESGACPGSCQFIYFQGSPMQRITSQEIEETGLTTLRVKLSNFNEPFSRLDVQVLAEDLCPSPD